MKNLILAGALSLFLGACSSNIINEHQELSPELRWNAEDVRSFEFDIQEPGTHNFALAFRYIDGFQFDKMRVHLILEKDANVLKDELVELQVIDANGAYIGEVALDIWDSEHLIYPQMSFEPGHYKVTLSNAMDEQYIPTPNCMDIGVVIE